MARERDPTPVLLPQWSGDLITRGGLKLNVRPASAADEPALLEFFRQASADDLRFRFLSSISSVGEALAHQLAAVDHERTENLLAFDARDGQLAASAMLAADDRMDDAEVAIIVRSDLRGRGIGWAMLTHACDYAKARGFKQVHTVELSSNRSAITLEEELGFAAAPYADDMSLTLLSKSLAA